jgi:hypothetical protein
MAKNGNNRPTEEPNVNDPGILIEENIYQKKNAEEAQKIPVEYLAYVRRRRASLVIKTILIWIVLIVLFAFGPGLDGQEICPECGRVRTYDSLAWGNWEFRGLTLRDTEWTAWYEAQNPMPHNHHWVLYGQREPSLFGYVKFPAKLGEPWVMSENLIQRMDELKPMFRPTKILEIPRVLRAVDNAAEWRAIILPLTLGTPDEAFTWWQENAFQLGKWSGQIESAPLPEDYMTRAEAYIQEKTPKTSEQIPVG